MNCLRFAFPLFLAASQAVASPLFPNSVVSNDIEFITSDQENAFYCLMYFGTDTREMPDKRHDTLFADGVYIFEAWFTDGTAIEITVHPEIGSLKTATKYAEKLTGPLGALPWFMRDKLSHVVLLKGNETAFAEDQGRFFTIYSQNMNKRIATHDLEETVFHESVHATLDIPFANSRKWRKAQKADGQFVTEYAKRNPAKEDLAETALFAYTYFQHPARLSPELQSKLEQQIPNRLKVLEGLFGPSQNMQRLARNLETCE